MIQIHTKWNQREVICIPVKDLDQIIRQHFNISIAFITFRHDEPHTYISICQCMNGITERKMLLKCFATILLE